MATAKYTFWHCAKCNRESPKQTDTTKAFCRCGGVMYNTFKPAEVNPIPIGDGVNEWQTSPS